MFFMICFLLVALGPVIGQGIVDFVCSPFGTTFIVSTIALLFISIVIEMLTE